MPFQVPYVFYSKHMESFWKNSRKRLNRDFPTIDERSRFSALIMGSGRSTLRAMEQFLRGRVLVVGAGDSPFRKHILRLAQHYDTLDREVRGQPPTYLADAQDMNIIPRNTYDTVVCLQVLEHLSDLQKALLEMARVMKPSGHLILSAPHLSRLHEEPLDFFRFTEYGLRTLLEKAGLHVEWQEHYAGLVSFLTHQLSTVIVVGVWRIPVVNRLVLILNEWLIVRPSLWIDGIIDRRKRFSAGLVVVGVKR